MIEIHHILITQYTLHKITNSFNLELSLFINPVST